MSTVTLSFVPVPPPTQSAPKAAPPRRPARPAVRPPSDFGLPAGYRQQTAAYTHDESAWTPGGPDVEYWNPQRIAASAKYQFHVYRWAAELIEARGIKSVLDVGCGPGTKLASLVAPVCTDIEGIDQASAISVARTNRMPGHYSIVDLEDPSGTRPWRKFDMIICSDVVEHLLDPDPALDLIKSFCHERSLILFSTPCRARLRGRACLASDKPEHVREWTHQEFKRFLSSRGFGIESSCLFPADDAPMSAGLWREIKFRMRLADHSPHRCQTILCRPH
jgi:SAM-dependent methyltransferase